VCARGGVRMRGRLLWLPFSDKDRTDLAQGRLQRLRSWSVWKTHSAGAAPTAQGKHHWRAEGLGTPLSGAGEGGEGRGVEGSVVAVGVSLWGFGGARLLGGAGQHRAGVVLLRGREGGMGCWQFLRQPGGEGGQGSGRERGRGGGERGG